MLHDLDPINVCGSLYLKTFNYCIDACIKLSATHPLFPMPRCSKPDKANPRSWVNENVDFSFVTFWLGNLFILCALQL